MRKEKQICDFGIKNFNKVKRKDTEVVFAARPSSGGSQHGKPSKGDTTAPGISAIVVSAVTATSVVITWNTNEETTGTVEYGASTSYGSSATASGSISHSASITGLSAGSLYNFRIVPRDLAGNTTNSNNQTFVTSAAAVKVLYLEFYGTTVANTTWNVSGPIVAAHSGLTDAEVTSVVNSIKAKFADFDILVTNDISIYNNTNSALKQKVIFTQSYEWFGNSAAGVAYINSFGWSDQSPAFIFTTLLNFNIHNIGEAGAHESGHTLGLKHQVTCQNGVVTSAYNWGDGITAPIMGTSYNVPSGDWWIGPIPTGCDNIQDDTAIIIAKIGLK